MKVIWMDFCSLVLAGSYFSSNFSCCLSPAATLSSFAFCPTFLVLLLLLWTLRHHNNNIYIYVCSWFNSNGLALTVAGYLVLVPYIVLYVLGMMQLVAMHTLLCFSAHWTFFHRKPTSTDLMPPPCHHYKPFTILPFNRNNKFMIISLFNRCWWLNYTFLLR